MKITLIIALIFNAIVCQSQSVKTDSIYGFAAVEDEFIIKFKPFLKSSTQYAEMQKRISLTKQRYEVTTEKEWTSYNIELWKGSSNNSNFNQDSIIQAIGKENIDYIEPNYIIRANSINLPTDPLFKDQWGLNNDVADVDIDAPEVWQISKGKSDVIVGIFDTGIDYNHEDLRNNVWTNPNEIPDNGIDDDNNGYIDDIHGYDFIGKDGNPLDENYHGTHVAGIIAAEENGIGIIGVAPKVKLISLRILDQKGIGATSAAIDAFEYAIKNNIRITNHSWGGPYSLALKEVIDRAEQSNILLVVASGNNAINQDYTPTNYPASFENSNIISFGSHDKNDRISPFSNTGLTSVDLFAPGSDILSTFPNNKYNLLSGTSMSTPFVTGAIALLKSYYPDKSILELKSQLLASVKRSPVYEDQCLAGGRLNLNSILLSWSPACINLSSKKMSFHGLMVNDKSVELQNKIINQNSQIIKLDSITCPESFYFNNSLTNKLKDITVNGASNFTVSLIFSPKKAGVFKGYLNIYYKSGNRQLITKCLLVGVGFEKGTLVQNQVSGTWTKAMSPIIVNSDLYVEDNKGLEIQPGVEVIFTDHFKISCDYKSWIKAIGNISDTVNFHPIDSIIGWNGVKLNEGHEGNVDFISQNLIEFVYCKFSYSKNHTKYKGSLPDDQMNGGAIRSFWAKIKINNCYFYKNSTQSDGGACSIVGTENFTLKSCTFNGNSAKWAGACSFSPIGEVHIQNCIFTNNTASCGILKFDYLSYVTISNSVFYKNGANNGAAITLNGDLERF